MFFLVYNKSICTTEIEHMPKKLIFGESHDDSAPMEVIIELLPWLKEQGYSVFLEEQIKAPDLNTIGRVIDQGKDDAPRYGSIEVEMRLRVDNHLLTWEKLIHQLEIYNIHYKGIDSEEGKKLIHKKIQIQEITEDNILPSKQDQDQETEVIEGLKEVIEQEKREEIASLERKRNKDIGMALRDDKMSEACLAEKNPFLTRVGLRHLNSLHNRFQEKKRENEFLFIHIHSEKGYISPAAQIDGSLVLYYEPSKMKEIIKKIQTTVLKTSSKEKTHDSHSGFFSFLKKFIKKEDDIKPKSSEEPSKNFKKNS